MEKERRSTWSKRRATWQYPPAPTPRILNLPTRHCRKKRSRVHKLQESALCPSSIRNKGKLAALFERERAFAGDSNPIVTILNEARRPRVNEEERIVVGSPWRSQSEVALKEIETKGIHLQKAINSAIKSLRVHESGDNGSLVAAVEYQIVMLEKVKQRMKRKLGKKGHESEGRRSLKEEELRKVKTEEEGCPKKAQKCRGCCRVMVNRVVKQVKEESEQWSQMQQMVEQVKSQVNKLRRSRDYWEQRTLQSHSNLKTIRYSAQAWKTAALQNHLLVKHLQFEVKTLKAAKIGAFQPKQRHPLGDITNTNYPRRESLHHHRPSP